MKTLLPALAFVLFGFSAHSQAPAAPPSIMRSTDHGKTWTAFHNGLPERASAGALLDDGGDLLLGLDYGGFYVLPEGSGTWEKRSKGLPEKVDINSIAAREDLLVIGTYHGRIFTSTNRGRNWKPSVFAMMGGSVRALQFHGDRLIAGTDNGIYRSADGGRTWRQTGDMVQVNGLAEFDGKLYAARRDGIVVSEDDGVSWKIVYSDTGVTRLMTSDGKLYATTFGQKIIRTTKGTFWQRPLMAIPGSRFNDLPAALWGGYKPEGPGGKSARSITETSVGWLLAVADGC